MNRFKLIVYICIELLYKTLVVATICFLIRILLKIPYFSFIMFIIMIFCLVLYRKD